MAKQWYYVKDGKRVGPVNPDQLKQLAAAGQLRPSDKVTCDGMQGWAEASKVKGLMPTNEPPPIPRPKASPSPTVAALPAKTQPHIPSNQTTQAVISPEKTTHDGPQAANRKGRGKKIALAVIAVLVLLFAIGKLGGHKKNTIANPGTTPNVVPEEATQVAAGSASPITLPDFSKVDYSYDFSKDDYTTIPADAKRETRTHVIHDDQDASMNGKFAEEEGYVTPSGKFISHGTFKTWYDEAHAKKHYFARYLNDKLHGNVIVYHENGNKKFEFCVVNGEMHGLRRDWEENGQLTWEGYFLTGKKHGVCKEWTNGGKLECEATYVRGVKEGPYTEWYPDGNKKKEQFFVAGEREGFGISWYDNGQKLDQVVFRKGAFHGRYQSWFEDGTLQEELMYDNGDVVYTKGSSVAVFLRKLREICATHNRQGSYLWFGMYNKEILYREIGTPDREVSSGETEIWTYNCGDGMVGLEFEKVAINIRLKETLCKRTSSPKTMQMTTEQFRSALASLTSGEPPGVKVSDLLRTFGAPTVEVIPYVPFRNRQLAYRCSNGLINLTVTVDSVKKCGNKQTEPASYRIAGIGVE